MSVIDTGARRSSRTAWRPPEPPPTTTTWGGLPPSDELTLRLSARVQDDLRVALDALVELLVRLGCLLEPELVRDDEARRRPARDDQVAKVPDVALDVALPRAHPQALLEQLADGDEQQALPRRLVGSARVGRDVEAGNTECAGGAHGLDQRVEDDRGLLAAGLVRLRLVAHRVDPLVGSLAVGQLEDLLDGVALLEVDRRRSDLARLLEPLWHPVDHEDA